MAATVRAQINARVLTELGGREYQRFALIYAKTCETLGRIPTEPAEEILNAFDHFSNAIREKDPSKARDHVTNGQAHILQARLICLIISITDRIAFISNLIEAMEDDADLIFAEFRKTLVTLRRQRNLLVPEVGPIRSKRRRRPVGNVGALEELSKKLNALMTDCNRLYNEFGDDPTFKKVVRARARAIWIRENRPEGKRDQHWHQAIDEIGRNSIDDD